MLKKFLTLDLGVGGHAQQLAFGRDQPPIKAVELFHQIFDAVVVEMHVLHKIDQLLAQLAVALFLSRLDLVALVDGFQTGDLQLVEFFVGFVDLLEGFNDFRRQLGFQLSERQVLFLAVFVIVIAVTGCASPIVARRAALSFFRFGLFRAFGGSTLPGVGFAAAFVLGVLIRLVGSLSGPAAVGGVQVNNIAQQHFLGDQRVMPLHDGADGQRAFADATDHHFTAGLNALGDSDLAFARQQFDRTHFAQVHADRVVGAAQVGFVDVAFLGARAFSIRNAFGGGRFFAVFAFDDIDAHFRQHGHGVFDLFRRDLVGGKRRVEVVIGDIPPRLAFGDHLLDGGV